MIISARELNSISLNSTLFHPTTNGVTPLQRRGRNKPKKRPFMQVRVVAGGRKCRVELKDFIRYGRA